MSQQMLGGSYYQVTSYYQQYGKNHGYEAHHIYSWSAYAKTLNISRGEGPAIRMELQEHRKTKSWDHRAGAKKYRNEQNSLLKQGRYQEAWNREVKDIQSKFQDKYNEHLVQAEKQLLQLDRENKIQLESDFKKKLEARQALYQQIQDKREELSQYPDQSKQAQQLNQDIEQYQQQIDRSLKS